MLPRPPKSAPKSPAREFTQSQEESLTRKLIHKHHQMAKLLEEQNRELASQNQELRDEYKKLKRELKHDILDHKNSLKSTEASLNQQKLTLEQEHATTKATLTEEQDLQVTTITTTMKELKSSLNELRNDLTQMFHASSGQLADTHREMRDFTNTLVTSVQKSKLQMSTPLSLH